MIRLVLVTGEDVWVNPRYVESVRKNPAEHLDSSLVYLSSGRQWAVDESPAQILELMGYNA